MTESANMTAIKPPNAGIVRDLVDERLKALEEHKGVRETVTIEWRSQQLSVDVITMPVAALSYNPDTHRIRAQRSLDPDKDRQLRDDPYGAAAQAYLHQLLMGQPADPSKTDPSFEELKEDLREHSQTDPGIITRHGVLINGNTRCAALRELHQEHIRVGVLPVDASHDDTQSIELALQLRKDHKRDYSFMNFLLALEERIAAGRPPAEIQRSFRIKATTFEQGRWILAFVQEAIERSRVQVDGHEHSLRLVDFESDKGKLEELYRAYMNLRGKSPDAAEALREQRLALLALNKSKTDLRLVDTDFAARYLGNVVPAAKEAAPPIRIPGTSITAPGRSASVEALWEWTTSILQAQAIVKAGIATSADELKAASETVKSIDDSVEKALRQAGKNDRIQKRRIAPLERLSDANEHLELALTAVNEAHSTGNFDAADLDDVLMSIRGTLLKLSGLVARGRTMPDASLEGATWLWRVANLKLPDDQG